ncbi:MAG: TolC family protein [Bacteroidales bacterium]
MRKRVISILATTMMGVSVMSQGEESGLSLDLKGAVEYAIANNKNLMNARQELVKSDKSVWEAISQGLPQVDAVLDYMTYFNYELQFEFGVTEDFEFTQEMINDAATRTLSEFPGVTAQDLYNHSAGNYYDGVLQSNMPPATIQMSDQLTAKLQVAQLIFSGQYIVGIQTARLAKIISRQSLENSEANTKESVVNAYYLVLITESSLDMVRQNLDNLELILGQTKKMYETGMAEAIDVDQFRITVNQLENSMKSLERNLELNYNMLRFTLGIPAGTDINLSDDLDGLFEGMEPAGLLLEDFQKESNITYRILSSQAEISKKLWKIEEWNFGPTISGFYNYNFKLRTTNFDMTPNHLAGFAVNMPIFSSGMRAAKTTQARIDYEIAERDAEILGDRLELQNRQMKYNLQSSLENYYTQKENVSVARRVLDSYRMKYQQGMASSMDVTQSNSNYLEAISSYLQAIFEVMNAKIQLEKLMNNLSSL